MDARIQDPETTEMLLTEAFFNSSSPPAALHLWQGLRFSEGYLSIVHEHWLSFPPPPRLAQRFLAVLYIIIMLTGIFGNSLVIFMFIKCKSLRTAANILVTNLAISDMAMMMKMPIFISNSFYEGDACGEIGCIIHGFVGGLTGTVSIMTLASISLDRYYVVVYPLQRASATLRARFCVVGVWIYGLIFASIPLLKLPLGRYVPEGYLTSCSFDYLGHDDTARHFILGYFFAAWVVPFIIICFCYSRIIKAVLKARHMGGKGKGESSRHVKDEEQKKTEIRLALIVLAIIGLWFVSWTPYATVALLGISGNSQLLSPLSSMIPALFCKTAACLDPFVYAITNQKFREELGNIFPMLKPSSGRGSKKKKNRQSKDDISSEVRKEETSIATIRRNESEDGVEEVIVMMDVPTPLTISAPDSKTTPIYKATCKDTPTIVKTTPNTTSFNTTTPAKEKNTPKRAISHAQVKPVDVPSNGKRSSVKKNTAAWVLKPTFSNRTSSLRSMARTWNRSKESSIDENDNI